MAADGKNVAFPQLTASAAVSFGKTNTLLVPGLRLGINFPWINYGWDFGSPPECFFNIMYYLDAEEKNIYNNGKKVDRDRLWKEKNDEWEKTQRDTWRRNLKNKIDYLKKINIYAVRWFILGDGLNYGVKDQCPHEDYKSSKKGEWRFDDPPKLSKQFEDDFRFLLNCLASGGKKMMLIPSLVDYKWCNPGIMPNDNSWNKEKKSPTFVKGGRSDVIIDLSKRDKFFKNVLTKLLDISMNYKDIILAWELINEPEWVVENKPKKDEKNLHVSPLPCPEMKKEKDDERCKTEIKKTIRREDMEKFIIAGLKIIEDKEFESTVGFARYSSLKSWDQKALGTLHQYHHYPDCSNPNKEVPKYSESPCIIGEFASASPQIYGRGKWEPASVKIKKWNKEKGKCEDKEIEIWPEMWPHEKASQGSSKINLNNYLCFRLLEIQNKGYSYAFIWSARDYINKDSPKGPIYQRPDRHTEWSENQKDQVMKYIKKNSCVIG
jgi:hypothetical protein